MGEQNIVKNEDIGTRTNKLITTKGTLVGALTLAIFVSFGYRLLKLRGDFKDYQEDIRKNLAPNAIYVKPNSAYYPRDFKVMGINEDVNGDGKYESVLKFLNPFTKEVETMLIERDGNQFRFRRYEVVNGQIRYLPDKF